MNEDGVLSYMKTFGGTNPDYPTDIKSFGSRLYISGSSQSSTLSSGFLDIFVLSCDKDTASINWIRSIGSPSFPEISKSIGVKGDGSIFVLGYIQAFGFTNGGNDVFLG